MTMLYPTSFTPHHMTAYEMTLCFCHDLSYNECQQLIIVTSRCNSNCNFGAEATVLLRHFINRQNSVVVVVPVSRNMYILGSICSSVLHARG